MTKYERLERTFAGEIVDRVPVMAWRHWPGDDQRSADFAWATVNFQRTFDWDIVKIHPFRHYSVVDYGVQTEWPGQISGDRVGVKFPVHRSLAWTELRPLDPGRGELGKQIEAIRLILGELTDVPVVATIYSPLTQAALIGEPGLMLRNMRTHADRLHSGLNVITDSVLRYIEALKRLDITGIVYVSEYADFGIMSPEEYRIFGVPYDIKILEALPSKWWTNILHLASPAPMFELLGQYPVQAVLWDSTDGRPELEKAWSMFKGALCTGVSHQRHLHFGTPSIIRDVARGAINQMDARRFILSPGDSAPVSTPMSNFLALREVVEGVKVI